ncbi:uncharacterized protein DUF3775 [Cytobacillus firmus]|uniref:Uncharacterized protein DUF3775 n=2 Tax=Cytobacillus TaxID=2675230 RepID=A0A366JMK0_CYTFI|nr:MULTISPECIES: DUF3775 domain-containing protein [Cytobacillus]RBP88973.1 uncharacterized protein DUF3775 [Cytobacillus firmus]TDX47174.1 uncharacterized protein DUF3775 [Cytobacillus oceanisediminis]
MSNQLFQGKEQIFKDVIRLAQTWKNTYESSGFEGGGFQEIQEFNESPIGQKVKAEKEALESYMASLSFDDIKMLQTIMYLGRDRDYDNDMTPEEIYNDYLESFNQRGWKTKNIETRQMTQKLPLSDYLNTGLEILNVKY